MNTHARRIFEPRSVEFEQNVDDAPTVTVLRDGQGALPPDALSTFGGCIDERHEVANHAFAAFRIDSAIVHRAGRLHGPHLLGLGHGSRTPAASLVKVIQPKKDRQCNAHATMEWSTQ